MMDHSRPLVVRQARFSAPALLGLSIEDRSALLLLGLFLNDVNWLRKLLARAVFAISDEPDGKANFALTVLLATTLAVKIHEGWNRIHNGTLTPVVSNLQLTNELHGLQAKLSSMLGKGTVVHGIRLIGAHYPNTLDFEKMSGIDDGDVTILATEAAYGGDILSAISAIACVETLVKLKPERDFKIALRQVWDDLLDCSEAYSTFVSEILALLLARHFPDIRHERYHNPGRSKFRRGPKSFLCPPTVQ